MIAPDETPDFVVRLATAADEDIAAIVRHRCEMFKDMSQLRADSYWELAEASVRYLAEAIPAGEYVGWLVTPREQPHLIVAGGGMQLRRILPRPDSEGRLLRPGPQGLVVNVYTEKGWRHKGLAELVMRTIIEWSRENGVASLVLHASSMGRPLYERMGFVSTNEMICPLL